MVGFINDFCMVSVAVNACVSPKQILKFTGSDFDSIGINKDNKVFNIQQHKFRKFASLEI